MIFDNWEDLDVRSFCWLNSFNYRNRDRLSFGLCLAKDRRDTVMFKPKRQWIWRYRFDCNWKHDPCLRALKAWWGVNDRAWTPQHGARRRGHERPAPAFPERGTDGSKRRRQPTSVLLARGSLGSFLLLDASLDPVSVIKGSGDTRFVLVGQLVKLVHQTLTRDLGNRELSFQILILRSTITKT